ncbi:Aspartate/glutamate/uridylate kinase [Syncephalastrum racemosum]|uniref:Aspartate/glutamate/uridylate kinase n=1 Tax=Syncephalastrum racemosum TaxID=13706 RepID=A0A1X2H7P6_SYNRA|nr:Aspartate/glutamate/uridylate kinase [Syncephalastrum racemosum]
MSKTVIIKLGGAAITNKKGSCQLAESSSLEALMDQIQQAYTMLSASGYQIILVHGAGSFGHPQARRYHLKEGWMSSSGLSTPPLTTADEQTEEEQDWRDQKAGFAHTRKCLLELHLALLSRLQRRGLPVLGISPFDHLETDGGDKSPNAVFEPLAQRAAKFLQLGFIPLLHGDAVFDRSLGCTILSGDIVMHKLAMLLPDVSRCVFITDVEGIYDADPKLSSPAHKPKLIKHMQSIQSSGVVDVTGGMNGKVKWARRMVLDALDTLQRKDLEVVICKSGSPEARRVMGLEPVLEDGLPIAGQMMTVFSIAPST